VNDEHSAIIESQSSNSSSGQPPLLTIGIKVVLQISIYVGFKIVLNFQLVYGCLQLVFIILISIHVHHIFIFYMYYLYVGRVNLTSHLYI